MRKVKVLIAVSPTLLRALVHLFSKRPEFEIVVASPGDGESLAIEAGQLQPELIVVNVRLFGTKVFDIVAEVERRSPGSKLLLISPVEGFAPDARTTGVDACLEESALVRSLVPTMQKLSHRIATVH
jgi:DNA-binding response OmpR family regulator